MATFLKISNGTVAQFNVLFIFVMAWCWLNATNLSRETLAASVADDTQHKDNEEINESNILDTILNY